MKKWIGLSHSKYHTLLCILNYIPKILLTMGFSYCLRMQVHDVRMNNIEATINRIDKQHKQTHEQNCLILKYMRKEFGPLPQDIPLNNGQYIEPVPSFKKLNEKLATKIFRDFVYEYTTNPVVASYNNLLSVEKKTYKSRFNRGRRAMKSFDLFMTKLPHKPTDVMELETWKSQVSKLIDEGIERAQTFISDNTELKSKTKANKISISLMGTEKTYKFISDRWNTDDMSSNGITSSNNADMNEANDNIEGDNNEQTTTPISVIALEDV